MHLTRDLQAKSKQPYSRDAKLKRVTTLATLFFCELSTPARSVRPVRSARPVRSDRPARSARPAGKSAQNPRFCARKARKWRSRRPKAHKKPDFVLETPENGGSRPQKCTKTLILCSKCPKTGVPDPKSAQKPRFCARKARKWGFQTPKAHKNLDIVLGKKGIGSGKRKYWHRKAQPWPSCKSPRTLSKCKCFITR